MDTDEHLKNAQEFAEKITALVQDYSNKIPLTDMAKVLATIQIDIMALHAAVQVAGTLKQKDETPEPVSN